MMEMQTFVAVSLGFLTTNWDFFRQVATLDALRVNGAGVPDEILEEFISVLCLYHQTRSCDNIPGILYEFFTFGREFVEFNR
jgi:hypothetical protein